MKMKMKDEDEFLAFRAGCEIGIIEINPSPRFPFIKIAPLKGRPVCLTGDAARLLLSFMCRISGETESLEEIKEHTDGIPYIC